MANAKLIVAGTEVAPESEPLAISDERLLAALKVQGISMGEAFAAAINAAKGKAKVTYGEYMRRPEHARKVLKRAAYQNGFAINPSGLSDSTIDKLAELETGRYMGGVVDVVAKENGPVYLKYKSMTPDDRMTLASHFTSFSDLVSKLHAEKISRLVKA